MIVQSTSHIVVGSGNELHYICICVYMYSVSYVRSFIYLHAFMYIYVSGPICDRHSMYPASFLINIVFMELGS